MTLTSDDLSCIAKFSGPKSNDSKYNGSGMWLDSQTLSLEKDMPGNRNELGGKNRPLGIFFKAKVPQYSRKISPLKDAILDAIDIWKIAS